MPGSILKSTGLSSGIPFYLPEWYAELYARVPGAKSAYFGGWASEPGAYLVNGPDMAQMTLSGTGDDPTVADEAGIGGEPAFSFPGKVIDTGMQATDEFTLICVAEVTDAMLAESTNRMMIFEASVGPRYLHLNNTERTRMTFFPATEYVESTLVTAGRRVIMATCRRIDASNIYAQIFVNNFETPAGADTLAVSAVTGANWTIGGRFDSALAYTGPIAAWVIYDRDLTVSARDRIYTQQALAKAVAWSAP